MICLHSVQMSNSYIWPIDMNLLGATTLTQSRPKSDSNEQELCIPQSSCITGASLSDCLVSYPRHPLWREDSPQRVSWIWQRRSRCYSTAPADRVMFFDMDMERSVNWHTCPDPHLGSWNCLPHQAHIALSEPMSSTDKQGSSLSSFPTFPSPLSPL